MRHAQVIDEATNVAPAFAAMSPSLTRLRQLRVLAARKRYWNRSRNSGILVWGMGCGAKVKRPGRPEAKMRTLLVAATTLMLLSFSAAQAKVAITIDKDAQLMTVA